MRRTRYSALFAALLLVTLAACGPAAPEPTATAVAAPTPTATPEPTPTPSPTPEPLVEPELIFQSFSDTFTAPDGTVVLTVSYTLPDFANQASSAVLTAIADWYTAEGEALLENASLRAQDAVSDYEVSQAAGYPFQATAEEITSELTYQSEGVLSFRREFYANAVGAAHPTVLRMGEQFDRTDGHKLTFSECFTDGLAAAGAAYEALLQSEAVAGLVSSGAVTAAQVEAAFQPDHFYLTGDGFVFWFQPGELSGVSNSPLEVTVPYSALEEYLLPWITTD